MYTWFATMQMQPDSFSTVLVLTYARECAVTTAIQTKDRGGWTCSHSNAVRLPGDRHIMPGEDMTKYGTVRGSKNANILASITLVQQAWHNSHCIFPVKVSSWVLHTLSCCHLV